MALQDEIRRVINEGLLPHNWTKQNLIEIQGSLRKENGEPYAIITLSLIHI